MLSLQIAGVLVSSVLLLGQAMRLQVKQNVRSAADVAQRIAKLAENCQDYPEGPDGHGFSLGDTVRVFKAGDLKHSQSGVVGCAEQAQPDTVCLRDGDCYAPDNLRHITAAELTLSTFRSTVLKVLGSVAGAAKEQWHDIRLKPKALIVFVRDKVTQFAGELAAAAERCDEEFRAATKSKLQSAFANIKSRIVMVVSTAADGVEGKKGDAERAAATAVAKLVKLQKMLDDQEGNTYKEHLKDTVEQIEQHLAGIAASAADDGETVMPEGLVENIDLFNVKVAELNGKLATLSEDTFNAAKPTLDALTTSTGRLVTDLSRRFPMVRREVVAMNEAALSAVSTFKREALQSACSREIEELGTAAFDAVHARFTQVVRAVNNGEHEIKESMPETADFLAAAVVAVGDELKAHAAKVFSDEHVQKTLSNMKKEVAQFKKLVETQSQTVSRIVDKFEGLFAKFMPQWATKKLRATHDEAKHVADRIRMQLEAITSLVTGGETSTISIEGNED